MENEWGVLPVATARSGAFAGRDGSRLAGARDPKAAR
jgi:hypothetical protein